jgi:hypothetical protein
LYFCELHDKQQIKGMTLMSLENEFIDFLKQRDEQKRSQQQAQQNWKQEVEEVFQSIQGWLSEAIQA